MSVRPAPMLALAALIPVAANPSLAAGAESLVLGLCGDADAVTVPMDNPLPGTDRSACCDKGCHSSDKRKRAKGLIDRAQ